MTQNLGVFNKTLEKSNSWIKELADELHWNDYQKSYRALRVVLHALRDHLTTEETVHLGAQMPMLIRGLYYEGWKPSENLMKERDEEQFLARVAAYFNNDTELNTVGDLENMISAVFRVISRHVTRGEISDIIHILPKPLKNLWT